MNRQQLQPVPGFHVGRSEQTRDVVGKLPFIADVETDHGLFEQIEIRSSGFQIGPGFQARRSRYRDPHAFHPPRHCECAPPVNRVRENGN